MGVPKRPARAAKAILWWCLAAGWIVVLFWFSTQPAVQSSQLSSCLAAKILRRLPFLDMDVLAFEAVLRKLAHFGIFAVEGFLIRIALGFTARSAAAGKAILVCLPLAVANELSELAAPGRGCSMADMGIDLAGAVVGILAAELLLRVARGLRPRGE